MVSGVGKKTSKYMALAAISVGMTLTAAHAMDARYTDADGDLVADAPKDAAQWRDPATLVFAFSPAEDPAVFAEVWRGFLDHLAVTTGKNVQYFPVQSNAAQIEAMRAGRLHVAAFNTGGTPLAVNCAGFVPFAMMTARDGRYGYQMQIITYPGSGIEKVEDIKGQKLAFTAETSNSGYKAPAALLREQFQMEAGRDYEAVFSGKHDNSILGVAHHDYLAAATASGIAMRMQARGTVKAGATKIIYSSGTFPGPGYGHAHDLKPELAAKIREAFFSFNWDGTKLQKEFSTSEPPQEQFAPADYRRDWEVVRTIDQAMGVRYDCR